ncbi:putative autophagy-related protein 11 [Achroia grisella]|uniref:putative autophagy-related protein 11 n=1 Tax=Achroia grisella TaxID=688607 RepID=UPI0027D2091E|nr:putative autophagy-related protein 11 [Achroia grisella]
MNTSVSDWRKPSHLNHISRSFSVAGYSTDTRTELKSESATMFFPEMFPRELSKTVMSDTTVDKAVKIQNRSQHTWFMGVQYMLSNMYHTISKIMGRTESEQYYGVVNKETSPGFWQTSNTENKNIGARESCYKDSLDMIEDCQNTAVAGKNPAVACEEKLSGIRQLLSSKSVPITPKPNRYRSRRPKKVFVESSSVEDNFEDAFAPEDFISHPNLQYLTCVVPKQVQHLEFLEIDAPKMKVETGPVKEHTEIVNELQKNDKETEFSKSENKLKNNTDNTVQSNPLAEIEKTGIVSCNNNVMINKQIFISCEMLNLETMLHESNKNNTNLMLNYSDSCIKVPSAESLKTQLGMPTMNMSNKHKNKNGLSVEKRRLRSRRATTDRRFSEELNLNDDVSSAEHSPRIKIDCTPLSDSVDYFDEISGRFCSNSGAESDDSFQVVFSDSPQLKYTWRPSDCESEDSFILFEDSPDSCYTSIDVFGDKAEDSETEYSDSEMSDSGCGALDKLIKLRHSMYTTFGTTDNNLNVDNSWVDEVDCSVRICEEISSQNVAEVCEVSEENKSTGILLNEHKKLLRKNQSPKTVNFSEKPPKVHVMRVWAFAARLARPGHWERYAIDRERFKRRIADADMALSWVLKPQHRSRVMFQRFMPWWNKQKRLEAAEKKQREEEEKKKRKEDEDKKKDEEEMKRKQEEEEKKQREEEEVRMQKEENDTSKQDNDIRVQAYEKSKNIEYLEPTENNINEISNEDKKITVHNKVIETHKQNNDKPVT